LWALSSPMGVAVGQIRRTIRRTLSSDSGKFGYNDAAKLLKAQEPCAKNPSHNP
jgi:hypothetical protein